jgi:hypothetical protein
MQRTLLLETYFCFIAWGGMRLSPLGTPNISGLTIQTPDDRWVWSSWWNESCRGRAKYSKSSCLSDTSSTASPTWSDPWSKPGRRSGEAANNYLSYGTTRKFYYVAESEINFLLCVVKHPTCWRILQTKFVVPDDFQFRVNTKVSSWRNIFMKIIIVEL